MSQTCTKAMSNHNGSMEKLSPFTPPPSFPPSHLLLAILFHFEYRYHFILTLLILIPILSINGIFIIFIMNICIWVYEKVIFTVYWFNRYFSQVWHKTLWHQYHLGIRIIWKYQYQHWYHIRVFFCFFFFLKSDTVWNCLT